MRLLYISIIQLSKYKIYIGHSIFNTILLSSWLIFNVRGKNTILNLYHTIKMLKISYTLLKTAVNKGFPFWFINFDLTKEEIIQNCSFFSGEFYVTRRWIRGLVSNFFVITKAYRKYLIKKDFIESNKVKDLYDKWFFTRFTWPRVLFISNIKSSFIVSKEASSARVPTIALVDSNVKTFLYNIPVACNDDSLESIGFMNSIMSLYILKCKYKKLLIWYFFKKNIKKYNTLLGWLSKFIRLNKQLKYKIKLKNIKIPSFFNYYKGAKAGLNFFFGRSYNFFLFHKKMEIKKNLIFFDSFYNSNKIYIYNRLNVFNYKNLFLKNRLKYKKYKYLRKIEGLSLFKSFLNNFIKLSGFNSRKKFIRRKKRIRMIRKSIGNSFKNFFHFTFFYYLNKFKIIIDYYKNQRFNIFNLIQISNNVSTKTFNKNNKKLNEKKYKYFYIFKYKSKKLYRRFRKKKYGYIYDFFNDIAKNKENMSFLFFFFKYFILFLGVKSRSRNNKRLFVVINSKIKKKWEN